MKKFRKLIPALALLLVSAVLMSTASYAWFSMNNKVTVTGMEVKTKVSSNLLIANDTLGNTTKLTDDKFTNELIQEVKGVLEPVSTYDGDTFFYTIDAKADGSKNHSVNSSGYEFIQYVKDDPAIGTNSSAYYDRFSELYDVQKTDSIATSYDTNRAVPYVEYVFQLKATNTAADAQVIILDKLNLQYMGAELDDKNYAHRVILFIDDITDGTVSSSAVGSSSTYKVSSSANWDGKVVSGTTTYADANYVSSKQELATVEANTTKYYKVVVRLWLEGQDQSCNNDTFMKLNNEWKLGIQLSLVSSTTDAVVNIDKIDSSAELLG